MTLDDAIAQVQLAYPQIYYACHTRHDRGRSDGSRLSDRDAALLVHLDPAEPTPVLVLSRHMDLGGSTVSESLTRLERLGYVAKAPMSGDRRRVGVRLTPKGLAAVRASSVLEPRQLGRILRQLAPAERQRAVQGLAALARACRGAKTSPRTIRRRAGD